jgi:hypothetical protein
MAVVTARAAGKGPVSVRIGGAGGGDTVEVVNRDGQDAKEFPANDRWEQLVVRLEQEQMVGDRLALIVELTDPRPGDRLDIGKVEIFAARYP